MDLINKSVKHEIFGEGTICEWNERTVSVQFGTETKKFIFPDAFRNHLVLTDKKSKKHIDNILSQIDTEAKIRLEQDMLKTEKMQLLKRLPICSKSQAAFGFIENEKDKVLSEWEIFAGSYRSGNNRGKPRTPTRIYPNSACLLTYCDKNDSEEKRYILGAFMVKEDFLGTECSDGIIPAHQKYRIILNDEQNKNVLLRDYFCNEFGSVVTKWGSSEIKYFSNVTMAVILKDFLSIVKGTDQQEICEEFLDYYCNLNRINKRKILGLGSGAVISDDHIA